MMQIVTHTPAWVFILFVVLLVFGFLQTRNRNVKFIFAYLLPIGMVILSFVGVISSFGLELMPISLWLAGVFMLSLLGYKLFPLKGIVYNLESKSYSIPGSWLSFGVIMAIFFTKYSVAVIKATNISLINNSFFVFVLCLAYGAFSGFFISRVLCLTSSQKV
jgi:hypothetical protein